MSPMVRLADPAPTQEEVYRETLERIADRGCRMSYANRPLGTTCLDHQDEAREDPDRFAGEFRHLVLDPGYPCPACQATAALEERI
jgi:hypothetical protein